MNTRDGQEVIQKHRSTGVTATVTIPTGQAYRSAVGWSVLTMDGTGALHVLRTVDGTLTVDTPVTGFPAGARPLLYRTGGSVARLAIVYALDGRTSVGLADLSDGAFRASPGPTPSAKRSWAISSCSATRCSSRAAPRPR
ncbi:hypothetical protein ACWGJ0_14000 [Streptomyces massasporeus]